MARYRHKSEDDLVWNRTRRRIEAEINLALRDVGEELKNNALWKAWDVYSTAMAKGDPLPEVEGQYTQLVREILSEQIPRIIEASGVEPAVD